MITNLRFLTNKALDMMKFESAWALKSKEEAALGPDKPRRKPAKVSCGLQGRDGVEEWTMGGGDTEQATGVGDRLGLQGAGPREIEI